MSEQLLQLGAGGALVVIVLREVFAFLKERKNGKPGVCQAGTQEMRRMLDKVNDLHEWHGGPSARTESGGFKWWLDKEGVDRLAVSIQRLSDVLSNIHSEQQITGREVERMANKLDQAGGR